VSAFRAAFCAICLAGWGFAFATGSIQLTAYPLLSVADGRSTVTITAVIRNSSGSTVSDGTIVRFSTTAGSFRDADVRTTAGTARAVLVAPNSPGVVTVTASASGVNAVSTYDVEFVRDRSMLNSARQYAEITGPDYLVYHSDQKIVSATGKDKTAKLTFRDFKIAADDMQINVSTMVVVATQASLSLGGKTIECKRLKYALNQRRGSAIAEIDGKIQYVKITAAEAKPDAQGMTPTEFDFADVGLSRSSIQATRIIAFPNREIQFHNAKLFVGDTKVLQFPLYALKPNGEGTLFSDQLVSFENGGLVLNYPQYLSLSPNFTSVLRLRSGQDYSRGGSSSQGIYLDFENHYMIGDKADGSLGLANIGRDDMGLTWRHTHRIDDSTTASAMLDMPGFKSLYGNMNVNRDFNGFTAQLSGTSSHSLRGIATQNERLDFTADTNTKRIGSLPLSYSVGFTATSAHALYGTTSTEEQGVGIRNRVLLAPLPLWQGANLTGSLTVTRLWGDARSSGFKILSTITAASSLGRNGSIRLSYDYAQDEFTSELLGRHRLTADVALDMGPLSATIMGSKALDIDSFQLFADVSWQFSKLWRVGSALSWDRYLKEMVTDHLLWLGYSLGGREIALTYSPSTQKFGFQLGNVAGR